MAIIMNKVISVILSIICLFTSNNILGGIVNLNPGTSLEDKGEIVTQGITGEESTFFSKLDVKKIGIESSVNAGNWDSAKTGFLNYCKNKFTSLDFITNHSGNDGSYHTSIYDTLSFSENYVTETDISSTSFSKVSFSLWPAQVSSTFLLVTLANSFDTGIAMQSRETGNSTAPTLTFHMKNGQDKSITAIADTYIRATGVGKSDNYATTAYGTANKNELWAMHCVDKDNQMPYNSNEMRTYLRFDYSSINMSDVSKVDLSVYAQLKNPNGGNASVSKLPLVLMVPYTKTWDENTVTWGKIADENGFGHYSWDGLDGIIYNETLYGELDSKLHVPSEYVNATSRFSDLTSLCMSGYYDKARSFLLRFCEQTYDVIATASKGVGGFPKNRPLEPANRCLEFPYIYKTLLEQNKLSAEDNYRIIKWYYQNMRYIYNENSQKIWTDGSTPNEATAEYISNWGFWHLCGYFFGFSFFDEFKEVPEWKDMFEARLAKTAGMLVNDDGSYIEVTLGYPVGVVSHCVELLKCMDSWNYTSKSYDLLRKRAAQIVQFLVTCAYSSGILPEYGDGGTGYVKNAIDTLMKIKDAKQYVANNYPEILWYYTNGKEGVKPQKSYVYKDAKLVTDRTGWTADDSMLFYNAKGGGQHAHHDALSLLFYTKGREMLFDPGTITYDPVNPAFSMRTMASAHNTVEVDGLAQNSKGKTVAAGYDGDVDNINMYANDGVSTIRSFTTANTGATHYRNVTYLKDFGGMILVNDKLVPNDSATHTYTQNWHVKNGAKPKVANSIGQFDDNVWGYTEFESGSNLMIAQSLTTRKAPITPSIQSGYDNTNSNGKTDYFEFKQSGSGNVCFDTALYAYDSTDSSKGIRINKLTTGTDDSVSSSMRIMMFADRNLTNQTGDIIYYNSFESSPSTRRVCRRVDSQKGYNGYTTNAANALYHINHDETIDMLSISNGTELLVYNSKASNMSTTDDKLAWVYTSESVKDLSVKYNIADKCIEINSSDMGVINGTTKVTVQFYQFASATTVKLNGRTLSSENNYTAISNGISLGADCLYFDFTNDTRAITRYKGAAYGSGKYSFDKDNWNNRIGTISYTPINSGVLSQQVINKDGYDGFSVTYIQPTADGTTGKNSGCLNYNISQSDVVMIKVKLRGVKAKSSTTVQVHFAPSFGSSDFSWTSAPAVSGSSLSDSYSVITVPIPEAVRRLNNIITFRVSISGLTQTTSESYIDYDYVYIGKSTNAPNKTEHNLYLRDTDNTLLYTRKVGYASGYGNLPIPGKAGFVHTGWYTSPTGGTKLDENATVIATGDETYYAHWEKYAYDISYVLAGGILPSGTNALSQNSGNKQRLNPTEVPIEDEGYDRWIKIENPTRAGYSFAGWDVTGMDDSEHHYWFSSKDNISNEASWSKVKYLEMYDLRKRAGTVTFTANWTVNSNKVTLDNQGATTAGTTAYYYMQNVVINNVYYYTDSACTSPLTGSTITKPTKTGYTFGGYFTGQNGTGTQYVNANGLCINNRYTVAGNVTLYAYWIANAYDVLFDNEYDFDAVTYENGNGCKSVTADYSSNTLKIVSSASDNYISAKFAQAMLLEGGHTYKITYTYTSTTGNKPRCTLMPYNASGTWQSSYYVEQVNSGYEYTVNSAAPYVFLRWGVADGAKDGSDMIVTNIIVRDITNASGIKDDVTAPKNSSNQDVAYAIANCNSKVSSSSQLGGALPTVTRTGYTFDGWYTGKNGTGTKYTNDTIMPATGNVRLYANWKLKSCDVLFDNEFVFDNITAATITNGYNCSVVPDYDNNELLINASGSSCYTGPGWSGCKDAKFAVIPGHTYRIYAEFTNTSSTEVSLTPVMGIFTFADSTVSETSAEYYQFFNSAAVGKGKTSVIDRTWTIPAGRTYATLRFDIGGASAGVQAKYANIAVQDITDRAGVSTPKSGTNTVFSAGVSYGTAIGSSSILGGKMPTETRTGYTFTGWNTKKDGTGKTYDENTVMDVAGTLQLWSQWTKSTYTVTWKNYDGTILETDKNVEYGTVPVYNSQSPCRSDDGINRYHFIGWSSEITPVTGDTVYTAVYESESVDFVLKSDSTLVINKNLGLIFGFSEDKLTEEFIKSSFENDDINVEKVNGKIGTGTKIILNDKFGEPMNTLTVVVIGDVNGDGRFDGMDAVLVSCLINGMISTDNLAVEYLFAADCNNDGFIDSTDVELLEQAGLGFAEISQAIDMDSFNSEYGIEIRNK